MMMTMGGTKRPKHVDTASSVSSTFLLLLLAHSMPRAQGVPTPAWVVGSSTTMNTPRQGLSAASTSFNNRLYMVGGTLASGSGSTVTEYYDPTGVVVTTGPSLATATQGGAVAAFDNTLSAMFLFGGFVSTVTSPTTTVRYLRSTGSSWVTASATLPVARTYHTATAAIVTPSGSSTSENRVYIAGGRNAGSVLSTVSYVKITSVSSYAWTTVGALNVARLQHASAFLSLGSSTKWVAVLGGASDLAVTTCLDSIEVLDTAATTWALDTATMTTARCAPGAVFFNGNLYVLGGHNGAGTYYKTMEVYSPGSVAGSGSWAAATSATSLVGNPRAGMAFGVVYGRMLALGGATTGSVVQSGMEYADVQSDVTYCQETATWSGSSTSIGIPDLPWLTYGFTFTGTIQPTSKCTGQCGILSKSNCANSEGGFQFMIALNSDSNQYFAINLGSGVQYFNLNPVLVGNTYTVVLTLTLLSSTSGSWKLTANGVSATITGPLVQEMPLHSVYLGALTSCNVFNGQLSNLNVGKCIPVTLTGVSPGYGESNFWPGTNAITFSYSDTSATLATTGSVTVFVGMTTGVYESVTVSSITCSAGTCTVPVTAPQLQSAALYTINIDRGILTTSTGLFSGLTSKLWTFGTNGIATTDCNLMKILLAGDASTFSSNQFCSGLQQLLYSIPCSNINILRRDPGSTVVWWRFTNMASGTCSLAESTLQYASEDGSLSLQLIAAGNAAPLDNSFVLVTSSVAEAQTFGVTNSPDAVGQPTTVSFVMKTVAGTSNGLPVGGKIILVFPEVFSMPTSAASTTVYVEQVPKTTRNTYTGSSTITITGYSITVVTSQSSAINNGATLNVTVIGASMPSACDTLNNWEWVMKLTDSSGTLREYYSGNTPADSCRGKTVILFGDPHFQSFSGGSYDVNGKAGYFYNIITDERFFWNAQFVSRNPRGHGSMHTFMGPSAMSVNGSRVFCDPVKWQLFVDGQQITQYEQRVYLPGGFYNVKLTKEIMYVRAPGFFIALKGVKKEHGKPLPHFDHVVELTDEPNGRTTPHGLLGQTATFKQPVIAKGHQGEGVIEGDFTQYEVPTLWSREFKYNRYRLQ